MEKPQKSFYPFMGGGTTLIEALKYNLRIIGNDLNPLTWFIQPKKKLNLYSIDQLQIAFDSLTNQISPKIKRSHYYMSRMSRRHLISCMFFG